MNRIAFRYGEFYDFPRQIRFQFEGQWYFMRSFFNEEEDDYSDFYDVYLLPFQTEEEFKDNPDYWRDVSKALHLGQIPVGEVGLDETRRRTIDGDAMEKWLLARKKESGV